MPEITVHHLNNSRSQRVLFLLEELGLDYTLVKHQRNPKTMRGPAALREIHPLGKSPIVVVDGVVLAESGAIVETLVEDFGPHLKPESGTDAARQYRYFVHYAEGSLMTPLLVALLGQRIKRAKVPFFVKPVVNQIVGRLESQFYGPELEHHGQFLDAHLAEQAWFAGAEFTAADILMTFGVEAGLLRGFPPSTHPRLEDWLNRVRARPAWGRALENGGRYEIGKP